MKASVTYLLFVLYGSLYAQDHFPLSDSALSGFYVTAVKSYCDTLMRSRSLYDLKGILLETNIAPSLLPESDNRNRFLWFKRGSSLYPVLPKPLRKNTGRFVYTVYHAYMGSDTLDIHISTAHISLINRKELWLGIECGGTTGNMPEARFIYRPEQESWEYICYERLISERLNEEKKQLGRSGK